MPEKSKLNKISSALGLKENDSIAIVGCGGKTTLMYELARELKDKPVLIATTTKIYPPSQDEVDVTYNAFKAPMLLEKDLKAGRYLIYGGYDMQGKLLPPDLDLLAQVSKRFDYTIMECDGSKGLPVKGYNDTEPCVPDFANTLIGVATLWAVGEAIDERFVHRVDEYCEMTGAKPGEAISLAQIAKLIAHPKGPFKKPCKRNILYLNHLDLEKERGRAMDLVDHLPASFGETLSAIVAGSLHTGHFEQLWPREGEGGLKEERDD